MLQNMVVLITGGATIGGSQTRVVNMGQERADPLSSIDDLEIILPSGGKTTLSALKALYGGP